MSQKIQGFLESYRSTASHAHTERCLNYPFWPIGPQKVVMFIIVCTYVEITSRQ